MGFRSTRTPKRPGTSPWTPKTVSDGGDCGLQEEHPYRFVPSAGRKDGWMAGRQEGMFKYERFGSFAFILSGAQTSRKTLEKRSSAVELKTGRPTTLYSLSFTAGYGYPLFTPRAQAGIVHRVLCLSKEGVVVGVNREKWRQ
ncbi:MAG: hypothetical protein FWH55_05270 [Oscillospiraceae bacterium]|nr:hypothetical protein [Oscillospiraceae bacterium]